MQRLCNITSIVIFYLIISLHTFAQEGVLHRVSEIQNYLHDKIEWDVTDSVLYRDVL